jgi:hypothetical protein
MNHLTTNSVSHVIIELHVVDEAAIRVETAANRPTQDMLTMTMATPNNDRVGGIATRCGAEGTDSGVNRRGLSSPHGGWIIDSRAICGG